ncbi:erythropoietin receptor-like isoform X1 [Arapaima gigas]
MCVRARAHYLLRRRATRGEKCVGRRCITGHAVCECEECVSGTMSAVTALRRCVFLLLACAPSVRALDSKASLLLAVEPEDPKCFAEGMQDLTCFWEEEDCKHPDQFTFMYIYQDTTENSNTCAVTAQSVGGSRTRYICLLSRVQHFVPLDITVFQDGRLIHNRSLLIDHVFLLDPPANVTVTQTGERGQLKVRWQPPALMYMKNSMMYEVGYAPAGSHVEKREKVRANTELSLHSLHPDTRYNVRVRVKPDGLSYSGYWSAWAPWVSMTTPPAEMDPLILAMCVIISFILSLLLLTLLLSHRRFLLKKMWPVIPSPEKNFEGLFNVYGGNFHEWLGFGNRDYWCSPTFLFVEENSSLEVLSEAKFGAPVPVHTMPSKPLELTNKEVEERATGEPDSGLMDRKRGKPHQRWLLEHLQTLDQHSVPCYELPVLESSNAYVSLNHNSQQDSGAVSQLDDMSGELSPTQVLFTNLRTPACFLNLGSLSHNSEPGEISSQSNLEYSYGTWTPTGPSYTCMMATDSGIFTDYSHMNWGTTELGDKTVVYVNECKNDLPTCELPPRGHTICSGC